MGSAMQPRDALGRWTAGGSGSETGDHLSESPSTETRNVAGQNLPRSTVIAKHAGADSVGTATPTVRMGQNAKVNRFASARSDKIAQLKAVDQRHFGVAGDVGSRVAKMLPSELRGPSAKGWPYNN